MIDLAYAYAWHAGVGLAALLSLVALVAVVRDDWHNHR